MIELVEWLGVKGRLMGKETQPLLGATMSIYFINIRCALESIKRKVISCELADVAAICREIRLVIVRYVYRHPVERLMNDPTGSKEPDIFIYRDISTEF